MSRGSLIASGASGRPLTFDMRGGRQLAKPDVGRPLDGRVRRLHGASLRWKGPVLLAVADNVRTSSLGYGTP